MITPTCPCASFGLGDSVLAVAGLPRRHGRAGGSTSTGSAVARADLGAAHVRPALSETDQVDAGQRAAELLHTAAIAQPTEIDHEETCLREQPAHGGLGVGVV